MDILTHWDAIEADLQDRGIDLDTPNLLRERTWRWLQVRVLGLLDVRSRLVRVLRRAEAQPLQES